MFIHHLFLQRGFHSFSNLLKMKKIKAYKEQKASETLKGKYHVPETQLSSPIYDGENWITASESSQDSQLQSIPEGR